MESYNYHEPRRPFSGSYAREDVEFLLKPVEMKATAIDAKEALIQRGRRHYSEMIAPEAPPDSDYLNLYRNALYRNAPRLAADVAAMAATLRDRAAGRSEIVLASLARAGTPIGVLLRRALGRLGVEAPHYSISIIRDRGVDREALAYIAAAHDPADVVFVDGWTGKGAIAGELHRSLREHPLGFRPFLCVVADPAGRADVAATGDDYLIPSGLLNAVVSGLVSRSILNDELVGPGDFHACVYYPEFSAYDETRTFVETVAAAIPEGVPAIRRGQAPRAQTARRSQKEVSDLMFRLGVEDPNRIKPGIAEATRAVLRRVPDRLLIRNADDPDLLHLIRLASQKGIPLDSLPPAGAYRAVAVIRRVFDGGEA